MEHLTNEEIGKIIKQKREAMGWTQAQLGERLGVGAAAVNKWEMGTVSNIKRDVLRNLSMTLKIFPAQLIGLDINQSLSDIGELTHEEIEEVSKYIRYLRSQRKN